MEEIVLKVSSPKAQLPGIDAAIKTMQELDGLYDGLLAKFGEKPIRITFEPTGMASVRNTLAGLKNAANGFESVGRAQAKMHEESAEAAQANFRAARENLAELQKAFNAVGEGGFFKAKFFDSGEERKALDEIEARLKKKIKAASKADEEYYAKTGRSLPEDDVISMDRALKAMELRRQDLFLGSYRKQLSPEALGVTALTEGLQKAAKADAAFAEGNARSAASVAAQDGAIQKKLLSLKGLEERLGTAGAADARFAAGNQASAQASAVAAAAAAAAPVSEAPPTPGLLKTVTKAGKEGPATLETYAIGPGRTQTYQQGAEEPTVETTDYLERYRSEARAIEADFKARMGGGGLGGVGGLAVSKGSPEYIELLRLKAGAHEALLSRMKQAGLGPETGQAVAQEQLGIQNRLAAEAKRLQQEHDTRRSSEANQNAARDLMGEIEREAKLSKQAAGSKQELAEATRREAAAYRQLGESMGGVDSPAMASLERKVQERAASAAARADGLERDMDARRASAQKIIDQFEALRGGQATVRTATTTKMGGRVEQETLRREIDGIKELLTLTTEFDKHGNLTGAKLANPKAGNVAESQALQQIKQRLDLAREEFRIEDAQSRGLGDRAAAAAKLGRAYRDALGELKALNAGLEGTGLGRFVSTQANEFEARSKAFAADLNQQRRLAKETEAEFLRRKGLGASEPSRGSGEPSRGSWEPSRGSWEPQGTTFERTAQGSRIEETLRREANGYREVLKLRREYGHRGELEDAQLVHSNGVPARQSRPPGSGGEGGGFGIVGTFAKTLGTVALWMTAYEVFFATVNAIKHGLSSMVDLEAHTAQLQSVMRGSKVEAQALRDGMLELAMATGRSGSEAMDAGVRWSRLGLSHRDTLKATEISLKSANISGMTASETAEAFSAIYSSYGVTMGQLEAVFNQMNAMAVRYNAADRDILNGLARVGSVAKQAGLELSETMSLIAVITGRTGRPGAEGGNALKRLLTNLSKPDIQEELRHGFGISVTDKNGDLKEASQILDELYLKYVQLGKAEQGVLLNRVAGAQQASRIAAMMDGYLQARTLEIQALGDVNRAEIENKIRRDTLQRDLETLKVSWQSMWVAAGDAGLISSTKAGIEALTDLMKGAKKVMHGAGIGLPEPLEKPATGLWDEARQEIRPFKNGLLFGPIAGPVMRNLMPGLFDERPVKMPWESEEEYEKQRKAYEAQVAKDMVWARRRLSLGNVPPDLEKQRGLVQKYFETHGEVEFDGTTFEEQPYQEAKNKALQYRKSAETFGEIIAQIRNKLNAPEAEKAAMRTRLEDVIPEAEPDPRVRHDLRNRMHDLILLKEDEELIAILMERQNAAREKGLELDRNTLKERAALLSLLNARVEETKRLIDAAERRGEEPAKLQRDLAALRRNIGKVSGSLDGVNLVDDETDLEAGLPESMKNRQARWKHRMDALKSVDDASPLVTHYQMERVQRELRTLEEQAALVATFKPSIAKTEFENELRQKRAMLEIDKENAVVLDATAETIRRTRLQSEPYNVGRNPTERGLNLIRGIEAQLRADKEAEASQGAGAVDAETRRNILLERAHILETERLALEDRRYKLAAEIVDKKREEAEQASKSLLMAGREDQMRAAMTAKYLASGGKFTADNMLFLDESVKRAVQSYFPTALPRSVRTPVREAEDELRQSQRYFDTDRLKREIRALMDQAASLQKALPKAAAQTQITENQPDLSPPANPGPLISSGGAGPHPKEMHSELSGLASLPDAVRWEIENGMDKVAFKAHPVLGKAWQMAVAASGNPMVYPPESVGLFGDPKGIYPVQGVTRGGQVKVSRRVMNEATAHNDPESVDALAHEFTHYIQDRARLSPERMESLSKQLEPRAAGAPVPSNMNQRPAERHAGLAGMAAFNATQHENSGRPQAATDLEFLRARARMIEREHQLDLLERRAHERYYAPHPEPKGYRQGVIEPGTDMSPHAVRKRERESWKDSEQQQLRYPDDEIWSGGAKGKGFYRGERPLPALPQVHRPAQISLSFGSEGRDYAALLGDIVRAELKREIQELRSVVRAQASVGRLAAAQGAGLNAV